MNQATPYLGFVSKFNKDLLEFLRRRPDVALESLEHATAEKDYLLDKERKDELIHSRSGDRIFITTATGTAYIRPNRITAPKYKLRVGAISLPFQKLFLSNDAQAGKKVSIIIGYEAFIEFATAYTTVKLLNVADAEVNPATKEGLDTIAALDFATQTTLALIKTKTDNLIPQATATPTTYNVEMTDADTEYTQVLPANLKQLTFFVRDLTGFRYAWVTGKVEGPTAPYTEVLANGVVFLDKLNWPSKTLYFACASAGKIMQIEVLT